MMLDWGGVLSRGGKGNTNDDKLKAIKEKIGLIKYYYNVRKLLDISTAKINDNYYFIGEDGSPHSVIMNSGFTKIYSLFVDDFIIYDGRVGAALGLLVTRWAEELGIKTVDHHLKFSYGNSAPSKKCQNNESRRNPSIKNIIFPNLFHLAGEKRNMMHIHNNIKASWLTKEAINKIPHNSLFNRVNNPMRAFEAALFMIGACTYYDCERNTKRSCS